MDTIKQIIDHLINSIVDNLYYKVLEQITSIALINHTQCSQIIS